MATYYFNGAVDNSWNTIAAYATGTVSFSDQPADADTLTINDIVFEFDNDSSVTGGNISVAIGVDLAATLLTLESLIESNVSVAVVIDGSSLNLTANSIGPSGNYAMSTTSSVITTNNMSGGSDSNWWTDSGFTTPATSLPTSIDDVIISSSATSNPLVIPSTTINSLTLDTTNNLPYLSTESGSTVNVTTDVNIIFSRLYISSDSTLNVGDTLTMDNQGSLRLNGNSTLNATDILIDGSSDIDCSYSASSSYINASNSITFNYYAVLYGYGGGQIIYIDTPTLTFDNASRIDSSAYVAANDADVIFSGSVSLAGYTYSSKHNGILGTSGDVTFNDYSYTGIIDSFSSASITANTITFNDYSWCGIDIDSYDATNIIFNDYSANGILYTTTNPVGSYQWNCYNLIGATNNITFNNYSGHGRKSAYNANYVHVGGIVAGNVIFNDDSTCGGYGGVVGMLSWVCTGWVFGYITITFNNNSKNLNGLSGINPTLNPDRGINGSSILGLI
jgi:hypothetical protein